VEGVSKMKLQPIDPKTLTTEILNIFDEQKALLTAGDKEKSNTMTIGWAQLGTVWGAPLCTVYVRPERYTYDFMEAQEYFTVSVLPPEHKKTTMVYCGTKSGRDVDKFKECELTVVYGAGDAPYIEEAELVLVCKKVYAQDLSEDHIQDNGLISPYYGAKGNWHRMYMGRVVEAYKK